MFEWLRAMRKVGEVVKEGARWLKHEVSAGNTVMNCFNPDYFYALRVLFAQSWSDSIPTYFTFLSCHLHLANAVMTWFNQTLICIWTCHPCYEYSRITKMHSDRIFQELWTPVLLRGGMCNPLLLDFLCAQNQILWSVQLSFISPLPFLWGFLLGQLQKQQEEEKWDSGVSNLWSMVRVKWCLSAAAGDSTFTCFYIYIQYRVINSHSVIKTFNHCFGPSMVRVKWCLSAPAGDSAFTCFLQQYPGGMHSNF